MSHKFVDSEKQRVSRARQELSVRRASQFGIVPIPGRRGGDHLDENLGAINIEGTPADLREIESAFSEIRVQGARLSEKHIQQIDQS